MERLKPAYASDSSSKTPDSNPNLVIHIPAVRNRREEMKGITGKSESRYARC